VGGGGLLAPRRTPKLEDHPLSAVRDCLFNIFAATLHIGRPSAPSATWERAMPWLKGTHLTWRSILRPTTFNWIVDRFIVAHVDKQWPCNVIIFVLILFYLQWTQRKASQVRKISKNAFKKHAYSMEYNTLSLRFFVTCCETVAVGSVRRCWDTGVEWINGWMRGQGQGEEGSGSRAGHQNARLKPWIYNCVNRKTQQWPAWLQIDNLRPKLQEYSVTV
jgi:hypothetical protein